MFIVSGVTETCSPIWICSVFIMAVSCGWVLTAAQVYAAVHVGLPLISTSLLLAKITSKQSASCSSAQSRARGFLEMQQGVILTPVTLCQFCPIPGFYLCMGLFGGGKKWLGHGDEFQCLKWSQHSSALALMQWADLNKCDSTFSVRKADFCCQGQWRYCLVFCNHVLTHWSFQSSFLCH